MFIYIYTCIWTFKHVHISGNGSKGLMSERCLNIGCRIVYIQNNGNMLNGDMMF